MNQELQGWGHSFVFLYFYSVFSYPSSLLASNIFRPCAKFFLPFQPKRGECFAHSGSILALGGMCVNRLTTPILWFE